MVLLIKIINKTKQNKQIYKIKKKYKYKTIIKNI